jgi:hypothetical protein
MGYMADLETEAVEVATAITRLENSLMHLVAVDPRLSEILHMVRTCSAAAEQVEEILCMLAEEEEEEEEGR